jgi:3-dehydroquinate dehydratase-2
MTAPQKWRVALLEGPNLGRLGLREPAVYGPLTHAELREQCRNWAVELGCELLHVQTESEADLIREIHTAATTRDGLIVNPGGLTHTSVALRDAVLSGGKPVVELHLTNPDAREEFRRRSLLADVVAARVYGFGPVGYRLALIGLVDLLVEKGPSAADSNR